jgi:hypothetical protein
MPKIEIEFTGTECFVVFDGTRIAKRSKNRTWISLEPGFVVSGDDDRPVIDHNSVRVQSKNRRGDSPAFPHRTPASVQPGTGNERAGAACWV